MIWSNQGGLGAMNGIGEKLVEALSVDAFGLVETSDRQTIFDSKHIAGKLLLIYDDQQVSGGGTDSVFTLGDPYVDLTVSASASGRRVRQSFDRFNYQPGKGLLILLTGIIGNPAPGITRRLGYFDDGNGIFFESAPDGLHIVIRNKGVDNRVNISDWNQYSRAKPLDFSKAQIFSIEIEWLGVGDVTVAFVINRRKVPVHIFDHSNALLTPYMSNPNLPIRYEIIADGTNPAGDTLRHICSSVMVQGGLNPVGFVFTAGRPTAFTMANNALWQPLLSMRLSPDCLNTTVEIINAIAAIPLSNQDAMIEVGVFINPTIAGTDTATWGRIPESCVEVDTSRTSLNTLTLGTRISGAYVTKDKQSSGDTEVRIPNVRKLGASIAGVPDQFVFAARFLNGTPPTVFAMANILELQ